MHNSAHFTPVIAYAELQPNVISVVWLGDWVGAQEVGQQAEKVMKYAKHNSSQSQILPPVRTGQVTFLSKSQTCQCLLEYASKLQDAYKLLV
ncbi:hypothetical protein E2C01_006976 [Portunus trituberculatus]|uniref:Uncharacterized protein n=1 Tax=Portunus trituberculatus TaxID=210409 RepID=A0A5B7D152_PORTR|nr:hypothetical protein [Portunus trituberculatus]